MSVGLPSDPDQERRPHTVIPICARDYNGARGSPHDTHKIYHPLDGPDWHSGVIAIDFIVNLHLPGPMARLSVVIPTYEEGENIGPLLRALRKGFAGVDAEFLVVDDDSCDETVTNALREGARVIVRETERGLATAVVRGIAEAKGEYVVVMDADFQHPPETVARMYRHAESTGADAVIASRYARDGECGEEGLSPVRRVVSLGAAWIARTLLRPIRHHRLTDPMSGLFLVRRDQVDISVLHPRGYKIMLEILARCPMQRVEEIGYVFARRAGGKSKLGPLVMVEFLLHVITLTRPRPRPVADARFSQTQPSSLEQS